MEQIKDRQVKSIRKYVGRIMIVIIVIASFATSVYAATSNYSGFQVAERYSILLLGKDTDQSRITFTTNQMITKYEANNPEFALVDTTYALVEQENVAYGQQIATYSDLITTYTNQISSYEIQILDYTNKIAEGIATNNTSQVDTYTGLKLEAETQKNYYQSLKDDSIVNRGLITYQKALNQFKIDHKTTLKNAEKSDIKKQLTLMMARLISIDHQLDYYNQLNAYNRLVAKVGKINVDRDESMASSYEDSLADVSVLTAEIEALSQQRDASASYIKKYSGIPLDQDVVIEFDLETITKLTTGAYGAMVDAAYSSDLQIKALSNQIEFKKAQINGLLSIYPNGSSNNLLMNLERDQMVNQLAILQGQKEQGALEKKNIFIGLKGKYASQLNKTNTLNKVAYEKTRKYNIGLETELNKALAEVNKQKSIWEVYDLIANMIEVTRP